MPPGVPKICLNLKTILSGCVRYCMVFKRTTDRGAAMAKAVRQIRVDGALAYVPLTQGREAVIDAADVPLVEGVNWCALNAMGKTYAARTRAGKLDLMHRVLTAGADKRHVDHIDGDTLNNCRSNLRLATRSENGHNARLSRANTSGVKGVSWHKHSGKWRGQIMHGRKSVLVGYFDTLDAAAAAMDFARDFLHGDFARNA